MKKFTKISFKYSIYIYLGLVAYFFLMRLFGLDKFTELRIFNFIIVLFGLYKLLEENIRRTGKNNFGNNFSVALRTSFLSILFFSLSLIVYLLYINPSFMLILENSKIWGNNLSVIQIAFAILVEGTASAFMLSFLLMQYFKSVGSPSKSMLE